MQSLISWFEIPVFDFKRAVNFYSKVFSHIEFDFAEFYGIPHAVFKVKGPSPQFSMTGALVEYKERPEQLCGPVLLFNANLGMNDIMENIKKHGGEILKEKTLIKNHRPDGSIVIPKTLIDGSTGYYAYFKDSEGNKMGLYSNS